MYELIKNIHDWALIHLFSYLSCPLLLYLLGTGDSLFPKSVCLFHSVSLKYFSCWLEWSPLSPVAEKYSFDSLIFSSVVTTSLMTLLTLVVYVPFDFVLQWSHFECCKAIVSTSVSLTRSYLAYLCQVPGHNRWLINVCWMIKWMYFMMNQLA